MIVRLDKGVIEYSDGIFIEDLLKLIQTGLPNSDENQIIKRAMGKIFDTLDKDNIENTHALMFAKNTYSYIEKIEKSA